jgi:hypothetical protein
MTVKKVTLKKNPSTNAATRWHLCSIGMTSALLLCIISVPIQSSMAAETVSYKKNIAPLLKRSCSKCHGAKKQKGELRLDSLKNILKGGENGKVVTPGNADKSPLYTSITLDPEDEEYMPVKGPGLDDSEIALIKRWINLFLKSEIKKAGI